jgi:hypothetical protein
MTIRVNARVDLRRLSTGPPFVRRAPSRGHGVPETLPDRGVRSSGWRLDHGNSVSDMDAPTLLVHHAVVPPAQRDQVVQVGVRAKWPLWCPSIHECMLSRPDGVIRRVSSPLAAAFREAHHDLDGAEGGDVRAGSDGSTLDRCRARNAQVTDVVLTPRMVVCRTISISIESAANDLRPERGLARPQAAETRLQIRVSAAAAVSRSPQFTGSFPA